MLLPDSAWRRATSRQPHRVAGDKKIHVQYVVCCKECHQETMVELLRSRPASCMVFALCQARSSLVFQYSTTSSLDKVCPRHVCMFLETMEFVHPPAVRRPCQHHDHDCCLGARTSDFPRAVDVFLQAKSIMHELAEGNRIEYAYIGIHMTTITPDFALQNNRDPNSHQLIPEVKKPTLFEKKKE